MKKRKPTFDASNQTSKSLSLFHKSIIRYRNQISKLIIVLASMIKGVLQDEFEFMFTLSETEVPNLSSKTKIKLEKKYLTLKNNERFQNCFVGNKRTFWLFKGNNYKNHLYRARLEVCKSIFIDSENNYSKIKSKTKSLVCEIQSCISDLKTHYHNANRLSEFILKYNVNIGSENTTNQNYLPVLRKKSIFDFHVVNLSATINDFSLAKTDIKDVYYFAIMNHKAKEFRNLAIKHLVGITAEASEIVYCLDKIQIEIDRKKK